MSIYLIGVATALVLCIILQLIEWYEGVDKQLGEEIFATVVLSMFSWLCAFFVGCAIVIYMFSLLQNVSIKGRVK